MLIVADNVSSSAQVIPLLPGVTSHRVIVTSRDSLADIVGARLIRLDELPISDAVDLMGQQLQLANHEDDRIAREPESAEAIALLCGCLPLALRIVASWLALDHQQQLSYMVGVLTDELSRLRNLRWDSTLDVRAVFDLSYRRLSREAAHLFRVMAANPGPEISAEAASAAANLGLAQTNDILRDLLKASLIAPTPAGPRRWRMHDLVHLYAKETLHEVGIERESAIDNLLDFYITRTALAEKHLDRSCKNPGGTIFVNRGEAIDWLDVEYPNLVSAVSMAYGENRYEYTLRLVFSLYYYFELRKHWSDWIATHEIALMSADKLGNDGSKANALNSMGVANQGLGQWDKAVEFHRRALTIYRRLGRMDAEARVLNNLGTAYRQLGSWRKAVIRHKQSLRLRQQLADYRGVGTTLNNLGAAYEKQGNYQQAVVHHNRALQVYAEHGTLQDYADARNRLGVAYHGLGRWDEAAECHRESIEIYREHNNKHDEADALNSLALVYQHTGHWEKAIDCHERSLVTYRDHGDFQGTAWALMSLGNTYHAMGRVMDANGNWQNALAIFNGLPGADASARVAELRAKLALLLDN
jgi:tetratricopeptide (TPR) repeat protein